ncbi:hypothetical protein SRHO_G00176110 [Serrasalmus rhombeus]
MSSVKEECEDVSVMEATGLKTEDQQMDREEVLREDIKEEHEPELTLFQEEYISQGSHQNTEPGNSVSDSFHQKDHPRIHTGKEAFSCSQCGKSFTSAKALKRHMGVHDGTKPHQCPQCNTEDPAYCGSNIL